jgi:thiamine biosynthesis lipoprotein
VPGTTASKWIRSSGVWIACLCLPALGIDTDATYAAPALRRFEAVEPHMGTLVRVTVYTPDEQSAKSAFRAAFGRIAALDRILSDYPPDSELNQLTGAAPNRPVRVSEELFAVLHASQKLARATDGAFDVTQGPVIRLWRDARRRGRLPDPAALEEAAERSGFRKLRLDAGDRTATLGMAGMALDVGAIGKGYAASEAVATLTRSGVRSALVAVSGDIAFSDAPPGRRGWRIAIDPVGVLELTNAAVSTAGSREQHLDVDGRRYSHIIDPSSGMGVVDDLTVTVLARHGIDADGLDTAASVLGTARGLALIDAYPGAAGVIVERRGTESRVITSKRFPPISAALPAPQ